MENWKKRTRQKLSIQKKRAKKKNKAKEKHDY